MLLNNLHALRVHTQGLFEDMGGEEVCQAFVLPIYYMYVLKTSAHPYMYVKIVVQYRCTLYMLISFNQHLYSS